MSGDVTTLRALIGKSRRQLEVDLGFATGRLAQGYAVLQLDEDLDLDDFMWGDQTRFSGRWKFLEVFWKERSSGQLESGYENVNVRDELRGDLLAYHGDEKKVDAILAEHQRSQQTQLNGGSGDFRIVKVMPAIAHVQYAMSDPRYSLQYPDSPTYGIPQWTLTRKKQFRCIDVVGPGK